jgi:uncharacterized protein (UPF0276 family)
MNSSRKCENRPGVGARPQLYDHLLSDQSTSASWIEVISENYIDSRGKPREILRSLRDRYPVALHGVSLSLASKIPPYCKYLNRLKELIDEIDPFIYSDHLCWTRLGSHSLHDLLPFPFTSESANLIIENIDRTQSVVKRQMAIENVSTYLTFENDQRSEAEFLVDVARRSGALILLDINNVFVNARNHGFNAEDYLNIIPANLVAEVHLAGFTDMGTHLFDTHSQPVASEVWQLFSQFIARAPAVPYMIEWDDEIPAAEIVDAEVEKASKIWSSHHAKLSLRFQNLRAGIEVGPL